MTRNSDFPAVINLWAKYLEGVTDWEELVDGTTPKETGCGLIYELPNPINRPDESFAIADMRGLKFTEPHYHANGETEIYFVLRGEGLVVVGGEEHNVQKNSVIVTPPNTAHFTVPQSDLVLATINTPPFKEENYVVITKTSDEFSFDKEQYCRLNKPQY